MVDITIACWLTRAANDNSGEKKPFKEILKRKYPEIFYKNPHYHFIYGPYEQWIIAPTTEVLTLRIGLSHNEELINSPPIKRLIKKTPDGSVGRLILSTLIDVAAIRAAAGIMPVRPVEWIQYMAVHVISGQMLDWLIKYGYHEWEYLKNILAKDMRYDRMCLFINQRMAANDLFPELSIQS